MTKFEFYTVKDRNDFLSFLNTQSRDIMINVNNKVLEVDFREHTSVEDISVDYYNKNYK